MRSRLAAIGAEGWAGLVLLCLAIVYWFQAAALPRSALGGSVGADGLPKLLGVALGLMSCLLILQSILATPKNREQKQADLPSRMEILRAIGFWCIAAGFVLVLPWAGYPVAVAAVLTTIGMYYGRRPSVRLLAFAIVGAVIFYLLFQKLLGVPMPEGIWPELFGR